MTVIKGKHTGARNRRAPAKKGRSVEGPSADGAAGNGAAAPAPKGGVDLAAVGSLAVAPLAYLWPERLPEGAVTLLAGDQSAGKSTLAAAVAAHVSGGPPLPGCAAPPPRKVLWLTREMDYQRDLPPLLTAAGCPAGAVYAGEQLPDGGLYRLTLPNGAQRLASLLSAARPGLLVLDPVTSYLSEGYDPMNGPNVRAVVECLTDLARATNCAVLGIVHPRKGHSGPLIERISGSRVWSEAPRYVLYLHSPDQASADRALLWLKPAPPQRPPSLELTLRRGKGAVYLEWGGESALMPHDVGGAPDDPGDRDALEDARALLLDRLADGPQKATDLRRWASDALVSDVTLRRAKKSLGVRSRPVGPNESRHHEWYLPGTGDV